MSMLFKRIKDWATSITAFRAGDVIPVDGPSGTAKMSKDALLALSAKPDGTYPDMIAGGQYVPRSTSDLNDQYSKNAFTIVEYQNTASHRPTPNGWYYGLAMCGGDSDFGAQIAPGMTIDRIFWRNRKDGTHGNWREIPSFPGTTGVGSASQPVYVDSEGTVKECNIRFIPVSGSWTAPNVSGDAKFTLYNSTGSSVSLTAGSLSKTLLADEYCDLLAVNGTWKKFSYSYT